MSPSKYVHAAAERENNEKKEEMFSFSEISVVLTFE